MAVFESNAVARDAKSSAHDSSPLARVMREFEELVRSFETGLLRSLEDHGHSDVVSVRSSSRRDDVRREACRLAISDLSSQYTPKWIRRSLDAAELEGKRVEDQLQTLSLSGHDQDDESNLGSLHNGYFRLYSTELFDLVGQPTDLRFGTLRFHKDNLSHHEMPSQHRPQQQQQHPPSPHVTIELALNHSFFIADSEETLPYHTFRLPTTPSLRNRGIRSRKFDEQGIFPEYDSWLLFTFLGNGCIKLEVPIEMCADVYGGSLRGRENEEVLFWGFFVDDDDE